MRETPPGKKVIHANQIGEEFMYSVSGKLV
jgi:hypothetical protein